MANPLYRRSLGMDTLGIRSPGQFLEDTWNYFTSPPIPPDPRNRSRFDRPDGTNALDDTLPPGEPGFVAESIPPEVIAEVAVSAPRQRIGIGTPRAPIAAPEFDATAQYPQGIGSPVAASPEAQAILGGIPQRQRPPVEEPVPLRIGIPYLQGAMPQGRGINENIDAEAAMRRERGITSQQGRYGAPPGMMRRNEAGRGTPLIRSDRPYFAPGTMMAAAPEADPYAVTPEMLAQQEQSLGVMDGKRNFDRIGIEQRRKEYMAGTNVGALREKRIGLQKEAQAKVTEKAKDRMMSPQQRGMKQFIATADADGDGLIDPIAGGAIGGVGGYAAAAKAQADATQNSNWANDAEERRKIETERNRILDSGKGDQQYDEQYRNARAQFALKYPNASPEELDAMTQRAIGPRPNQPPPQAGSMPGGGPPLSPPTPGLPAPVPTGPSPANVNPLGLSIQGFLDNPKGDFFERFSPSLLASNPDVVSQYAKAIGAQYSPDELKSKLGGTYSDMQSIGSRLNPFGPDPYIAVNKRNASNDLLRRLLGIDPLQQRVPGNYGWFTD